MTFRFGGAPAFGGAPSPAFGAQSTAFGGAPAFGGAAPVPYVPPKFTYIPPVPSKKTQTSSSAAFGAQSAFAPDQSTTSSSSTKFSFTAVTPPVPSKKTQTSTTEGNFLFTALTPPVPSKKTQTSTAEGKFSFTQQTSPSTFKFAPTPQPVVSQSSSPFSLFKDEMDTSQSSSPFSISTSQSSQASFTPYLIKKVDQNKDIYEVNIKQIAHISYIEYQRNEEDDPIGFSSWICYWDKKVIYNDNINTITSWVLPDMTPREIILLRYGPSVVFLPNYDGMDIDTRVSILAKRKKHDDITVVEHNWKNGFYNKLYEKKLSMRSPLELGNIYQDLWLNDIPQWALETLPTEEIMRRVHYGERFDEYNGISRRSIKKRSRRSIKKRQYKNK